APASRDSPGSQCPPGNTQSPAAFRAGLLSRNCSSAALSSRNNTTPPTLRIGSAESRLFMAFRDNLAVEPAVRLNNKPTLTNTNQFTERLSQATLQFGALACRKFLQPKGNVEMPVGDRRRAGQAFEFHFVRAKPDN